mmetsp:Transcript_16292/g.26553  ORF Transcript_16292/g.26553 Transcript_16292/m.26553 type:complete len:83 (-) Transcript_16292:1320-1568(-)
MAPTVQIEHPSFFCKFWTYRFYSSKSMRLEFVLSNTKLDRKHFQAPSIGHLQERMSYCGVLRFTTLTIKSLSQRDLNTPQDH